MDDVVCRLTKPFDVSACCATLNLPSISVPKEVSGALFAKTVVFAKRNTLKQLDDKHLGDLLWAISRSGLAGHEALPFMHVAARELAGRAMTDTPASALVKTAWAFASTRYIPGDVFNSIAKSMLSKKLSSFSTPHLATLFWSFVAAGFHAKNSAFLRTVEQELATRDMRDSDLFLLANTAW